LPQQRRRPPRGSRATASRPEALARDHEQLIIAAEGELIAVRYGARAGYKNNGGFRMRKLIIAATALAFIASPALAQTAAPDKGAAPAATGTDASKDTMKKAPKKAKKSTKKKSDDTMSK
jgi:hypothetical protein